MSYHTPIFAGLKALTLETPLQATLLRRHLRVQPAQRARRRLRGTNDWLASWANRPCGPSTVAICAGRRLHVQRDGDNRHVWFTGEMEHVSPYHQLAIHLCASGTKWLRRSHVIRGHTNTARGRLPVLRDKLHAPDAEGIISHPLHNDTSQMIDLETEPLTGGFLINMLVLSIDQGIRGRMKSPEIQSYTPGLP
ncbi:hypothetical protein FB451DRAFT_1532306 [Mycena latifolia]|nr:hypothetical protein FB451DRAFT_1532306 [Mycena latifolia]